LIPPAKKFHLYLKEEHGLNHGASVNRRRHTFVHMTLISRSSVDHDIAANSWALQTSITRAGDSDFFPLDYKSDGRVILIFVFSVDGHVLARTNVAELGDCMRFGHPVILKTSGWG
jgi:hypothetical protein